MKKILSFFLLCVFSTTMVQAQSYSPDRPGIGNGSFITPVGMLGLEAGFQFSNTDLNEQYDIGQLVLRYGVSEKLELRALLGSYTSIDQDLLGGSRSYSGFQDIGLGLKYNLIKNDGKSNLSAMAEVSLPVGSDEFTSHETIPAVSLLGDHAFNENLSVSSNIGYSFNVGDVDGSWLFTITPGFAITDNAGGYFGYAGNYSGSFEQHWVEAGVTYGLNSGVKFDVNFGFDPEHEIAFVGAGIAKGF